MTCCRQGPAAGHPGGRGAGHRRREGGALPLAEAGGPGRGARAKGQSEVVEAQRVHFAARAHIERRVSHHVPRSLTHTMQL